MSSLTLCTGKDGCTESTRATSEISVIGANAVLGSNGKFFCKNLFRNQRRVDREKQRVAIGLGTGGSRGSGGAAGAAAIVDDDILPERLAQRLAQDARRGIGRASGREIDDKRDGTAGILLRRGKRHGRHRRRAAESQDEFAPSHKQIRLISPYADGVMARGH